MPEIDVTRHLLGLLDGAPKTQEKIAEILGAPAHPSGAGQAHLNIEQGGLLFQWHPVSRKVYWLKPVFKDGRQTHFSGQVIALDIVTHGDAYNAVLIWKRGYDEGRSPGSRANMNEGG